MCKIQCTTVPVDDLRRKLIFNRLPKCSSDLVFFRQIYFREAKHVYFSECHPARTTKGPQQRRRQSKAKHLPKPLHFTPTKRYHTLQNKLHSFTNVELNVVKSYPTFLPDLDKSSTISKYKSNGSI